MKTSYETPAESISALTVETNNKISTNSTTTLTSIIDLRYVHFIGFAKVGKNDTGKPTVLLLDEEGVSKHTDPNMPLVFTRKFLPNQIFDTTLNDVNNTPVNLINILAEFNEELFNIYKENIPSLGDWKDAEASDGRPSMNPTDPPKGTNTVQQPQEK